jgi:diguanylate cyclase (GGDEF)-like protein
MKPDKSLLPSVYAYGEISALIETLYKAEQRLEELTAGEVDTVADRDGQTFLLRRAQNHLRHSEAAKQAAILNALPAHIALLDNQGLIVSVNEAWRRSAGASVLRDPGHAVGLNYLEICDGAHGDGSSETHRIAAGIRAVLAGRAKSFSIEIPCHAAMEPRWFLLTVTPLADDRPMGVVVMHLDVTAARQAEIKITQLNRVYAVLSGINILIVRVRDRDELFQEACRIAVEAGGFRMAVIGMMDRNAVKMIPVALAGREDELLTAIEGILSSTDGAPSALVAQAIAGKTPVVSNDTQNDVRVAPGQKYVEFGVRSIAILPLVVSDEAVGVLALYANESEFFHAEEMRLLTELSGDIAFAIDHIGKQEQIEYLAYYDVLTGLANRSLFLERVAQYMRSAVSGKHKLAVFLIDLERFKNINDSLGQPAGDTLLRHVAEWLIHNAGDAHLLARIGADHFAAVLPVIDQEGEVAQLIERMMEVLLEHPFRLDDAVFRIAAKVGVAQFPQDGVDAGTLFKNAEAALKEAKASGDRYLFYMPRMTETVAATLTLENQLRQALDKGEFVLHYQPKVNLASGRLVGAEALIR